MTSPTNPPTPPNRGTLYVVATPIGNRQDWSPRAVETLKSCTRIYCEDTRHSLPLLQTFGINVPLVSLHQHNERGRCQKVLQELAQGEALGLISDAGTPALSDPGAQVVYAALMAGHRVSPIPGASAAMAAWSASGFAAPREEEGQGFTFLGFLPTDKKAQRQLLQDMAQSPRPMMIYEAPHRLIETLAIFAEYFPPDHDIFYGREITKVHENCARLTLAALRDQLEQQQIPTLGEWVLILAPRVKQAEETSLATSEIARRLRKQLEKDMSPSALARVIHQVTGLPRQALYKNLIEN